MIGMISKYFKANQSTGLLPVWWFRVYYIYIASTVLIAAKLQPDLSMQFEVLEAWEQALSILKAHRHISPVIQQSIITLETLSAKVWESQGSAMNAGSGAAEAQTNMFVEDLFRDMGFDPINPPFGLEDTSWLNSFPLAS